MPHTSVAFVSQASVTGGTVDSYKLRKRIEVIKNCRNIGKKDMKFNDVMPKMRVDPESYVSDLIYCVLHLQECYRRIHGRGSILTEVGMDRLSKLTGQPVKRSPRQRYH